MPQEGDGNIKLITVENAENAKKTVCCMEGTKNMLKLGKKQYTIERKEFEIQIRYASFT